MWRRTRTRMPRVRRVGVGARYGTPWSVTRPRLSFGSLGVHRVLFTRVLYRVTDDIACNNPTRAS